MALEAWFQSLGISPADAQFYKEKFVAQQQGLPDDENALPKLGLSRSDLETLQVKLVHRQTILNGIQDVERGGGTLADDRKDFIRRFFAVAVSVGFAGRLVNMPWVQNNVPLDDAQIVVLTRLLVGVFVVVSGWEWYHRDLRRYPLNNPWRFYVDVAVVVYTIVFLFSSNNEAHWLLSLVAIFALYVVWDVILMIEYRGESGAASGYITDVIWLLYFVFVWWISGHHPLITCAAVFLGAAGLRALNGLGVGSALTLTGFLVRIALVGLLGGAYYFAQH